MSAAIGWIATAVFTLSYLAKEQRHLRMLQMIGASLWLVYGIVIAAPPVIVANGLLLVVASWTSVSMRRKDRRDANRQQPMSGSAAAR